jgi:TIR domain
VLFLADDDSRDDDPLLEAIEAARAQLVPVLPVVQPGADISTTLPDVLRPLNAIEWDRAGGHAIGEVARLLGLAETERRLFLSYRRHDTSSLALQLREHLSRRAFDVFLDRFSVPPAADFQHRINVELADKAFVLLLASSSAAGSGWVQHEVGVLPLARDLAARADVA